MFTSEVAPCGLVCSNEDLGLRVIHRVYSAKVLIWDLDRSPLLRSFNGSLEVKVQYGRTAAMDSQAWTDLTAFVADTGTYVDDEQRVFSAESNLHYRLIVRTSTGTIITSQAVRAQDSIPARMVPAMNELLRRWRMRANNRELRAGFLLKRRRWGSRCPDCRDRDGGQQIKTDCPTCYDTQYTGGYFQPIGCSFAEVGPYKIEENYNDQVGYSADGFQAPLTMLNMPCVYPGDVWVEYETDHRWEVQSVEVQARIGSVETIIKANAGRLNATSIVYAFPVTRT